MMNQLTIARPAVGGVRPVRAMVAVLGAVKAGLAAWARRQRERRALLALSDVELKDIGISRAQANFEHNRPFWRP